MATVRARVEDYFKESNLSPNANKMMWIKTLIFIGGFIALYILLISDIFSFSGLLPIAALLGVFSAFVGFNVCHDAIHGSFSSSKTVNRILSTIFHFLGASPYVWTITHNAVHHTYTNIPGHDEDIDIAPGLIRLSVEEPINKIQRFQHWYAFPLYSLASLSWAFRKDFKKFFQAKIGQTVIKHPAIEYFSLFFYKMLYYFLFIALPLMILSVSWWQFIIVFLVMHIAQGLTMGMVFQLAHVVEGTDFPTPSSNGCIEEAWAEHQMRTTANFATKSRMASFLLGGLNRQIEHHLFPKVCHIHYGKIGNIVKQTAKEFNIPYLESPTFFAALRSHYRVLKKFSKEAACN
ncbi:acyl-CoA desaturase [Flavobacterium sp. NRK1]|uniref:fatty acid desaturase family protein n=1 Tax=Flavobacterium sp. NRK1 TaxID=2954929 RepID=UPI0020926CF7|nr:acyl-CoA desaturase [Flavobacterium sp. NRK1]MCO6149232.1 acyl-CoA desaturase [Flavobacterium sp. NRK1]